MPDIEIVERHVKHLRYHAKGHGRKPLRYCLTWADAKALMWSAYNPMMAVGAPYTLFGIPAIVCPNARQTTLDSIPIGDE